MKSFVLSIVLLPLWTAAQSVSVPRAGGASAAMGHATVAVPQLWSTHHNVAALASLEQWQAGVSYQNRFLQSELSLGHAALAVPVSWGTLGLALRSFGGSQYHESEVGLSYSRSFGPHFQAGLRINYHHHYVAEAATRRTASFDLGLLARPAENWSLGFQLRNPGGARLHSPTDQALPTVARLGGAYFFSDQVTASLELSSDMVHKERYALGFEYFLLPEFCLRVGMSIREHYQPTGGMGFKWEDFSADLAYENQFLLGHSLTFSIQKAF